MGAPQGFALVHCAPSGCLLPHGYLGLAGYKAGA